MIHFAVVDTLSSYRNLGTLYTIKLKNNKDILLVCVSEKYNTS